MGQTMLSKDELKEILLEMIREDRDFRYLLMGVLGMEELAERLASIDKRISALAVEMKKVDERIAKVENRIQELEAKIVRLEERVSRVEERIQRLEARVARVEERIQRLEERVARVEERIQRLEERVSRVEERIQRLEARVARVEERIQRLEERVARVEERIQRLEAKIVRLEERVLRLEERMILLEKELRETKHVVQAVAARFGVITEAAFRESLKYILEETYGVASVDRWIYRDEKGEVYGHPSIVEADVIVKDGRVILIEIKSSVHRGDVAELKRIATLYEKVTGKKAEATIIAGLVDPRAEELAHTLGVKIIKVAK